MVVTYNTSCNPGTKPTLPELLKFTCTDGRVISIPVQITTKYVQFGAFLLGIKSQEYGAQTFEQFGTDKHRNPPGMADWKWQAASGMGHSC